MWIENFQMKDGFESFLYIILESILLGLRTIVLRVTIETEAPLLNEKEKPAADFAIDVKNSLNQKYGNGNVFVHVIDDLIENGEEDF